MRITLWIIVYYISHIGIYWCYRYLNLPDCTPEPPTRSLDSAASPSEPMSFIQKRIVIVAPVYECPGRKSRSMGTLIIVTSFTTPSTGPIVKLYILK